MGLRMDTLNSILEMVRYDSEILLTVKLWCRQLN